MFYVIQKNKFMTINSEYPQESYPELYEKIKQNQANNIIKNEYINKGMEIYNATDDISIKESILTKLIEIIPRSAIIKDSPSFDSKTRIIVWGSQKTWK